jgi:hypothetical protein
MPKLIFTVIRLVIVNRALRSVGMRVIRNVVVRRMR